MTQWRLKSVSRLARNAMPDWAHLKIDAIDFQAIPIIRAQKHERPPQKFGRGRS